MLKFSSIPWLENSNRVDKTSVYHVRCFDANLNGCVNFCRILPKDVQRHVVKHFRLKPAEKC